MVNGQIQFLIHKIIAAHIQLCCGLCDKMILINAFHPVCVSVSNVVMFESVFLFFC